MAFRNTKKFKGVVRMHVKVIRKLVQVFGTNRLNYRASSKPDQETNGRKQFFCRAFFPNEDHKSY